MKISSLLWLIPVCLFAWVGWTYADLDGVTTVTWQAEELSPFVHGLRPTGRVQVATREGEAVDRLTGDPVYLSVTPPGSYEEVRVRVWFDPHDQPLVELGATVNASANQVDLRGLWNAVLEDLDWARVTEGGVTLYQQRPEFVSVADLMARPPALSTVATYRTDWAESDRVPLDWTRGERQMLDTVSLRGMHEWQTATSGGTFTLTATYMDMNRNVGADPISVRVLQDGQVVGQATVEDDGVDTATNASLGAKTVSVRAEGLQAGVLKVELNASSDVYWRVLASSLPKMTFARTVQVGDEVGYLAEPRAVTLWTDAEHLTFKTLHAEGVQTVRVGDTSINIALPHQTYDVDNARGLTRVDIPRGDMIVATDGRIAFSPSAFFAPSPKTVDDRSSLASSSVTTILARYTSPQQEGAWKVGQATFGLPALEREQGVDEVTGGRQGSVRFVLSLPRVQERQAFVDIARVEFEFRRPPRSVSDMWALLLTRIGL